MSENASQEKHNPNTTKSICIPKELYDKAMRKASSLDRSFSWLVRTALKKEIKANEKNVV